MRTHQEILQIFVSEAIANNRVSICHYWKEFITPVLESMGYIVMEQPMTYTRIMGSLTPDRNFDILAISRP